MRGYNGDSKMNIDLATFTKRSQFIEAWNERELYIDHILKDLDIANEKLQEYEGIPKSKDEKEIEFQKFWKMYGRKGNLKTSRSRFNKLTDKKKALIFKVLPDYIKSTPKGKIPDRKNAETWLNQECWNDVIEGSESVRTSSNASFVVNPLNDTLKENAALRAKNKTVNIRDKLKL